MVKRRKAGFTLIEMMVTLAIMALLLLVGAPLGRAWVANAHIAQAESQLLQAYERTRALALRNPAGVTAPTTAATLCITNGNTLKVYQGAANCTTPSTTPIWSGSAATDTSLCTPAASTCPSTSQLNLDNNGMSTSSLSYTVSANGGTNASGTLH